MKALITTTINVPTVLRKYREGMDDDDIILVAGDMKSPHDEIEALLKSLPGHNWYLRPEVQINKWKVSRHIGWNCIQRRNIALLEALATGAETITTVDDDNIPFPEYFGDLQRMFDATVGFESSTGWYNPALHCIPRVVHRGFPYSQRHINHGAALVTSIRKIGVVAGLWYGDPDIDAMERLVSAPIVREMDFYAHNGFALGLGTWAPFNTQNTTFVREVAPAVFCPPHVGRFDDIWASYIARAVMDRFEYHVAYGRPFVEQVRNDHDLFKDLRDEFMGYTHTDHVTDVLREVDLSHCADVASATLACYEAIQSKCTFLPHETTRAMFAWIDDLEKVL